MLDKILKFSKGGGKKRPTPKHIAFSVDGNVLWADKEKKSINEAFKLCFQNIYSLFENQVKHKIPIITVYIKTEQLGDSEKNKAMGNYIVDFLRAIKDDDFIHHNKIKISFLGKWYDLPGEMVESIRGVIDQTKDYDYFFFNFCLNYNGQDEIVDATKIIARKIQAGKLSPLDIDRDMIKENTYSSYYLPPDVIVVTGEHKYFGGLLLWDSPYAKMMFTKMLWPEFKKDNFYKVIDFYSQ